MQNVPILALLISVLTMTVQIIAAYQNHSLMTKAVASMFRWQTSEQQPQM